jgi:hypothetical protein
MFLNMPNLHFLPCAPVGCKFEDDVYVATSEPHGNIEGEQLDGCTWMQLCPRTTVLVQLCVVAVCIYSPAVMLLCYCQEAPVNCRLCTPDDIVHSLLQCCFCQPVQSSQDCRCAVLCPCSPVYAALPAVCCSRGDTQGGQATLQAVRQKQRCHTTTVLHMWAGAATYRAATVSILGCRHQLVGQLLALAGHTKGLSLCAAVGGI